MTTQINQNALRDFIISKVGQKATQEVAKAHKISDNEFAEANADENDYLEIDEIMNSDNLLAQFTQEFVEAKKESSAESKEQEDEKLNKKRFSKKDESQA